MTKQQCGLPIYDFFSATVLSRGERCDKCHRPGVCWVFRGVKYDRWQKRCHRCAERMVREGRARFAN